MGGSSGDGGSSGWTRRTLMNLFEAAGASEEDAEDDADFERVKELLKQGVNANLRNLDDHGHTALMYAAKTGNFDIVKLLIKNGADPELKNDYGETAISQARERGYENIAEYIESIVLMRRREDVLNKVKSRRGETNPKLKPDIERMLKRRRLG